MNGYVGRWLSKWTGRWMDRSVSFKILSRHLSSVPLVIYSNIMSAMIKFIFFLYLLCDSEEHNKYTYNMCKLKIVYSEL